MWGNLGNIAANLKNTIESFENDLDEAVGGNKKPSIIQVENSSTESISTINPLEELSELNSSKQAEEPSSSPLSPENLQNESDELMKSNLSNINNDLVDDLQTVTVIETKKLSAAERSAERKRKHAEKIAAKREAKRMEEENAKAVKLSENVVEMNSIIQGDECVIEHEQDGAILEQTEKITEQEQGQEVMRLEQEQAERDEAERAEFARQEVMRLEQEQAERDEAERAEFARQEHDQTEEHVKALRINKDEQLQPININEEIRKAVEIAIHNEQINNNEKIKQLLLSHENKLNQIQEENASKASIQMLAILESEEEMKTRYDNKINQLNNVIEERNLIINKQNEKIDSTNVILNDKENKLLLVINEYDEYKKNIIIENKKYENKINELNKEINKLNLVSVDSNEKDDQILGLIEEGKKLAKKQGELQKFIKDKNTKIEEFEKEKTRLIADKETLKLTIVNLEDRLNKHESNLGDTSKSLAAMHVVSQQSSDRLSQVELELKNKINEIIDLKSALEMSWQKEKDNKKSLHTLAAQNEALTKKIQDNESAHDENIKARRELANRESLLQSTQRQLEDSITRSAHEANLREDSLRAEITDMRRRWQDATSRCEELAADTQSSTAPLLRQLRALQDEGRHRQQAWALAEATLLERCTDAEHKAEDAIQLKIEAEERDALVAIKLKELEKSHRASQAACALATAEGKVASSARITAEDRAVELEAQLETIQELQERTARDLKASNAKLKLLKSELNDMKEGASEDMKVEKIRMELKLNDAMKEIHELKCELENKTSLTSSSSSSLSLTSSSSSSPRNRPIMNNGDIDIDNGVPGPQPGSSMSISQIPSGFVVQLEKLRQEVIKKEAQAQSAMERHSQLQVVCNALSVEVQELGKRNSFLEEQNAEAPKLKKQNTSLSKRNNVLLELLGEKTEELEDVSASLDEAKRMLQKSVLGST